jgi:hypothetical protein
MQQATGYLLSMATGPEAIAPDEMMPSAPNLWVAMYIIGDGDVASLNQSVALLTETRRISGVVVIGFIDRPLDLIDTYYYLKVPLDSFNKVNALGYASCLAFQYGADRVLIGLYPKQSPKLSALDHVNANVLIDLTPDNQDDECLDGLENSVDFSLLVNKRASYLAYLLAQLPGSLRGYAVITVFTRLAMAFKEGVVFINDKTRMEQQKAKLNAPEVNVQMNLAASSIKQLVGIDMTRLG